MLATPVEDCSENVIRQTIGNIHHQVCGHAPYSYINLLFIQNMFWNDKVERHLVQIVDNCPGWRHTALPQNSRTVSLSSPSRPFNELICVDHFSLDENCLLLVMGSATRFSSCVIVPSPDLTDVFLAYKSC